MISLHKLHLMFMMKRCISTKWFLKISIKTLTIISCPNFKNKQKRGLSSLKVELDPSIPFFGGLVQTLQFFFVK